MEYQNLRVVILESWNTLQSSSYMPTPSILCLFSLQFWKCILLCSLFLITIIWRSNSQKKIMDQFVFYCQNFVTKSFNDVTSHKLREFCQPAPTPTRKEKGMICFFFFHILWLAPKTSYFMAINCFFSQFQNFSCLNVKYLPKWANFGFSSHAIHSLIALFALADYSHGRIC